MANLKDLIVNGAARIIGKTYSSEFVGNVAGNVTGNVTGNLTGNVTGNVSGSSGSCTGNAATSSKLKTAVSLTTTDGSHTSEGVNFDGSAATSIKLPATIKATFSGNLTGDVTGSVSGNAGTATKLKTARSLKITDDGTNTSTGVDFDGTDAVTLKLPSTIKASLAGNATTAATADKTAYGISVGDGVSSTAAISSWKGNEAKTLAIKGTSPITTTATTGTITITHNKGGANTSKGDTDNQAPGFGGTFKVTSATVDEYGHTTTLADHTVTIPSSVATASASGLMSVDDKSKLDGIAGGAEVNQNAFSNVTVGSTTISADSKTDTLALVAGDNITLTPDSKTVNISVTGLGTNAYSSTSYLPSAGGIMTGNIDRSTYKGGSWISGRDNAAIRTSSTTSGSSFAPIISAKTQSGSWDLGPCHPGEYFYFSYAKDSNYNTGSNSTMSSIYFTESGYIYGNKVWGAVFNDLADAIPVGEGDTLEAGYCYGFDGEHYTKTSEYMQKSYIGIHSDTFGFLMGHEEGKKKLNVAVSGFVLAYVDKEYEVGTPLTCTADGCLTEIKLEDKIKYPERVVATYWKNEPNEEWGPEGKKVKVNGRRWVKVK